jgi:hypothetical protein
MGAGANFLLSVPQGAVNFAVLEGVRTWLDNLVESSPALSARADRLGFGLDFVSSAISTIACSVVSTPQMMITDNIMAGNYANMPAAIRGLAQDRGLMGFYAGWWPGLVGKIPSYALTWTLFQQLKRARNEFEPSRPANNIENGIMGCIASGTTVSIMIPLDTIKTRLVTQTMTKGNAYKGIIDCAIRVTREEGIKTFYRGLPPRLISVVPMIGIQFGVYEFMKRAILTEREKQNGKILQAAKRKKKLEVAFDEYDDEAALLEVEMEVAASPNQPFPAPHFLKRSLRNVKKTKKKKVQ